MMQKRVTKRNNASQATAILASGILQRRAVNQFKQLEAPPIVHEVLRSPGQPIDLSTRNFIEPRFGHDFSHVRVHADTRGKESARVVNALAYTVGKDIVFGAEQYRPNSVAGQKLLAHELTHTLQQSSTEAQTHPITNALQISTSGDPYEREAESVARRVESGYMTSICKHTKYATVDGKQARSFFLQRTKDDSIQVGSAEEGGFGESSAEATLELQEPIAEQKDDDAKRRCEGAHSLNADFYNYVDVNFYTTAICKRVLVQISGEWHSRYHHMSGPSHFPIILDGTTTKKIKAGHRGGAEYPREKGPVERHRFRLKSGRHTLRLSTGGINDDQPTDLKVKLKTKGFLKVS